MQREAMKAIIRNATLVNEGKQFQGNLVINGSYIESIFTTDEEMPEENYDYEFDATGLYLLPGVIDDHVHFRDPGLTHKADIASESRAAAAGGVTSYMDMPNTLPQTTTLEALEEKFNQAAKESRVNYTFFFGATNDNAHLLAQLDTDKVCGIKLFMGSSTGNMLVDDEQTLKQLFAQAPMLIMAHCEDQQIIKENSENVRKLWGEDPDVSYHPLIRSREACRQSTQKAVELARETGARLHIAHVSTADELTLFDNAPLDINKKITAEACVAHLYFSQDDYQRLGTRIKCNPAIKNKADRQALREALNDNRIDLIGTDHAPHLLTEKEGGALKAVSGMPMLQFSLVAMLELADEGVLSIAQVVDKMCHAPARLFQIKERGFLRPGYRADLVLVRPQTPWEVTSERILSKCGWSPLEGHTFNWKVEQTFVNGQSVYANGYVNDNIRGEALEFNRS